MNGKITFWIKDEAKLKLCKWKKWINEFCKKHKFEVQEMFTSFVISFYNEQEITVRNGCCM